MVQVAGLFNQLLHQFPRLEFAALAKKHQTARAAKGFDCWTQFVAMLFCQLGHADSLREICNDSRPLDRLSWTAVILYCSYGAGRRAT